MPIRSSVRAAGAAVLALLAIGCHDGTSPDAAATRPILLSLYVGTPNLVTGADIYAIGESGSSTRLFQATDGFAVSPAWSRDGRRIAFARVTYVDTADKSRGTRASLWTMNADGSNVTRLPATFDGGSAPAWSPDGTRLSFYRDGLYVARLDGSDVHHVATTAIGGYGRAQGWSPDGTRLLYVTTDDNVTYRLRTVAPDGSAPTLLPITDCATAGSWSPDGARIAFSSCNGSESSIYVSNVDGTGRTRVTSGGSDYGPVWSGDGASIAFQRYEQPGDLSTATQHVLVAALAGGPPRDLTPGATAGAVTPTWRP